MQIRKQASSQKKAIRCKSEASDRKQALEANQKQAIGSKPSQYYAERPAHAVNRGDDSVEGPMSQVRVEYDDNDDGGAREIINDEDLSERRRRSYYSLELHTLLI